MNYLIIVMLLGILLAVLWGPSGLVVRSMRRDGRIKTRRVLAIVWPAQLLCTGGLVALEDYLGLRNPAGLVLATSFAVSLAGALIVLFAYARSAPSHP